MSKKNSARKFSTGSIDKLKKDDLPSVKKIVKEDKIYALDMIDEDDLIVESEVKIKSSPLLEFNDNEEEEPKYHYDEEDKDFNSSPIIFLPTKIQLSKPSPSSSSYTKAPHEPLPAPLDGPKIPEVPKLVPSPRLLKIDQQAKKPETTNNKVNPGVISPIKKKIR